jgi:uncharacterized C2H2 Zn-finger protein
MELKKDAPIFHCPHCSKVFPTKAFLKFHVKEWHSFGAAADLKNEIKEELLIFD